jgi:hypothetical protein
MSDKRKFLVGCGAGIFATLVGTALLSTTRDRRPRWRATDAPGKIAFDSQSNGNPGASLDLRENQAQGREEFERSDCRIPLNGDPAAGVSVAKVRPANKLAWYRRLKAKRWITALLIIIVAAALVVFAVDSREQMKKMSAQLTRSETTMMALQDGVRNDERAWVGLMEATPQPLNGSGGGFTIKLQNTGKTPALDVHISDVITVEDIDQAGEPKEPDTPARNSAGTLMPGGVYTTDVWFQTSPDAVSSLQHNQMRAVNFVHVTYKDVFQMPHATKVCFYWHSSLPRVKPCDGYNEMN